MAMRYSGTIAIRIRLMPDDTYNVLLTEFDDAARFAPLTGLRLAPIHANRLAADSAEAYDRVAEAALGFASYEDETVDNYALREPYSVRWQVRRPRARRFAPTAD